MIVGFKKGPCKEFAHTHEGSYCHSLMEEQYMPEESSDYWTDIHSESRM